MRTSLSFWSSRAHDERSGYRLQTDRFSNAEVSIQDPTPKTRVERVIPADIQELRSSSPDELWPHLPGKRMRNAGLLPLRGDADSWAFLRQVRTSGLPEGQVEADELALVKVEGIKAPFLAPPDVEKQLEKARGEPFDGRVRFLSSLDPLIWSRNALKKLWDFEYVWEVYKPTPKRRWGYYVLPVLYGDRFVTRFDGKYDSVSGTLQVLAYHEEPGGLPWSHPTVSSSFQRFLFYLGGERTAFPDGGGTQAFGGLRPAGRY